MFAFGAAATGAFVVPGVEDFCPEGGRVELVQEPLLGKEFVHHLVFPVEVAACVVDPAACGDQPFLVAAGVFDYEVVADGF